MFLSVRKKYWFFLAAALALGAGLGFLHFSPVFAWRNYEATGPFSERLTQMLKNGSDDNRNLFRLDKEELLNRFMARPGIEKLHLRMNLPGTIEAQANYFQPVALVLDGEGRLFGLDRLCRLVPFDTAWTGLDIPVFTGLKLGRLFDPPRDFRVAEVVAGLEAVRDDNSELYGQLAEVDFSGAIYVQVFLTSSRGRFLARSVDLAAQLAKLPALASVDDWSGMGVYNLSYDGVVIRER